MRLFSIAALILVALLSASTTALSAPKSQAVEVPWSRLKAATPAEKKSARAYAKANNIRWKINWRK